MTLAILQNELAEPTEAQLAVAFEALPGLTAYDAKIRARDVSGLIATRLDEEEAAALLHALALQGIAASIIEDSDLPKLATSYRIKEARPHENSLTVMNARNEPQKIEWSSVKLIAAGWVSRTEVERKQRPVIVRNMVRGATVVKDHISEEHHTETPIAEILLNLSPFRLRIEADQFRFGYLGGEKPRGLSERFDRLVLDLASFAPQATINRGADAIIRDLPRKHYRSMQMFEQEIIWLNWLTDSTAANK